MAHANRILNAVSEDERRRLAPHLERVHLPSGKILFEVGDRMRHAFFPIGGIVSLLATTASGAAAEVAMVGNDGVVGLPILLPVNTAPYQVLVQITGDAYRMRGDVFLGEFRRDGPLQAAIMEHLHQLIGQLTQSGVCNRFHPARQRLCRWLLMAHDRVQSDTIPLTQEFIGHMLGANRKRVSAAAATLQDAGYIRQRHGEIRIVNRRGLERSACECYRAVERGVPTTDPPRRDVTLHHRPVRL
jgi:CRP-like cAMP-binding protein